MEKNATCEAMEKLFFRAGINLTREQSDLFWRFYLLFDQYNDAYDLSRIKRFEDIVVKHFIDSAIVYTMTDLPSPLLDIGTGPGFPGIPLKIMSPQTEIILAEPRDKRVEFMEMAIKELSLQKVSVYPKRVGDHNDFEINGVVTRAFEECNGTLDRVKHFLPQNGRVLFLKGPGADSDIDSIAPDNREDYTIVTDKTYTLGSTVHQRRLLVFEKQSSFREHVYTATDPKYASVFVRSAENSAYREAIKLLEPKYIRKNAMAIISGKKVIREIADQEPESIERIYIPEEYRERDERMHLILQNAHSKKKVTLLSRALFRELDYAGTNSPLIVYRYSQIPEWDFTVNSGVTLLIPFQDPANVGSVLRTAAAFNVKRCILLEGSAHPYHPKSLRAASGCFRSLELCTGPSIEETARILRNQNIPLIALDSKGSDIRRYTFPEKFTLLPGVEGPGIPAGIECETVSIPISSQVESLNASSACAVALYQISYNRS